MSYIEQCLFSPLCDSENLLWLKNTRLTIHVAKNDFLHNLFDSYKISTECNYFKYFESSRTHDSLVGSIALPTIDPIRCCQRVRNIWETFLFSSSSMNYWWVFFEIICPTMKLEHEWYEPDYLAFFTRSCEFDSSTH